MCVLIVDQRFIYKETSMKLMKTLFTSVCIVWVTRSWFHFAEDKVVEQTTQLL